MAQFRTKARAVELLGKGQIADLPTAITELWKNGYDAYADSLNASLFCKGYKDISKPLFVITDDGTGMSEEELLNNWMVIGTQSKTGAILDKRGPNTLGKIPRIKTGEKGIGRLSISYLGSQMLMITKKRDNPTLALFFDWRILDNYNLFIEEIHIPLIRFDEETDINKSFDKLITEFLKNLKSNYKSEKWEEYEDIYSSIIADTAKIGLPAFAEELIHQNFKSAQHGSHGTMFFIFNPIDQIIDLQNADKSDDLVDDSVMYTMSSLSGLANPFVRNPIECYTNFNIYKSNTPVDIINQRKYFTFDDYDKCDHLIEGAFDENGFFEGNIRIYKKNIHHKFKPIKPPGKRPYGPFEIKIGYLSGLPNQTLLSQEEYSETNKRLGRFGGLYIYRDGFRVLPYGRLDQDFLEFEARRSKHAGIHFFSIRRMFGYISITRNNNSSLRDKAGREGFINNLAYREFKDDLIHFFTDLSRKYFGTKAEYKYKSLQQEEIAEEKLEKKREKIERREFNKNLKEYPVLLKKYIAEFDSLLNELSHLLNQAKILYEKIETVLISIDEVQSKLRKILPPDPKRFKPSDNQRRLLFNYTKLYDNEYSQIDSRYSDIYKEAKDKLKEKELLEEFGRKVNFYKNEFQKLKTNFDERIKQISENLVEEIGIINKNYINEFDNKSKALYPIKLQRIELNSSLELLDKSYLELSNLFESEILPFLQHLEQLNINIDEDKLVGYYKVQYEEMKSLWEQTQELAQLGIAAEIIDHQFNALYSELANIISMFKDKISDDTDSQNLYKILVSTFDHLQNNYRYLTPLYRTTGRSKKKITGLEIREYIEAFFSQIFQVNNITLTSTKNFDNSVINSYESIIKPVFINVINNAVYWLASATTKKIHLSYEDEKYIIMNSGQEIDEVFMKEDIFKLFFSRKPKGRGIGLYLAKSTLNGIGLDIYASTSKKYNRLNGACFIISKTKV